jgi:hypothetical protein
MRVIRSLLGVAGVLSLVTGCEEFKQVKDALQQMIALQQGISETFGEPATTVNIVNDKVIVSFVSPVKSALPDAQRAKIARNVALYVRGHYADYAKLSSVQVGFTSQRTGGVLTSSETHWYTFRRAELDASADSTAQGAVNPAEPPASRAPAAKAPAAPAKRDSTKNEEMPPPLNPSR